jgi:hypothetical protein
MCSNSTLMDNGLLQLDPTWNTLGWIVLDDHRSRVGAEHVAVQSLAAASR